MRLVRRLSEGVGAWLQFETHCNRKGLFSERYLSAPIGQILGAVYGSNVHAEVPHPSLVPFQKGPGAKARLDFAAFGEDDRIVAAVESKWIGATVPGVDKIVWDLIRLELVASQFDAECCFILGGKKRDLAKLFDSKDFRGTKTGHARPVLPVKPGVTNRYRMQASPHYRWPMHRDILHKWQDLPVAEVFETILTKPCPIECVGEQHQIYAWSVQSAAKRDSFTARMSKHFRAAESSKKKRKLSTIESGDDAEDELA
jgi:hypothetical protein